MTSPHSSSNPSSAFDLLAEPVRRWIWDQGWTELRDIQERAITMLLNGDRGPGYRRSHSRRQDGSRFPAADLGRS